jgi:purine-binding chemotaxis protein CheW
MSGVTRRNADSQPGDSTTLQYVSFTLGNESYAIDIMKIREVREWEETTKLPDSPNYMIGALDIRGNIVPVIDLKQRLGFSANEIDPTKAVIVLKLGEKRIGLLVDTVADIDEANHSDVKPAPNMDGGIKRDYINGVISNEKGMLIILEAEKLFSDEMINQLTNGAN